MNKQGLIEAVAARLNISRARASDVVDAFFDEEGIIAAELRKGGTVQVSGFGSFETRARVARTGRNPQTGEAIPIPASTVPVFRAGRALKDAVSGVGENR